MNVLPWSVYLKKPHHMNLGETLFWVLIEYPGSLENREPFLPQNRMNSPIIFNSCRNCCQSCWPRSRSRACQYLGIQERGRMLSSTRQFALLKYLRDPTVGTSNSTDGYCLMRLAIAYREDRPSASKLRCKSYQWSKWRFPVSPSECISLTECFNDYGITILSTQSNIIVTCVFLVFILKYKRLLYFAQCPNKESEYIRLPYALQLGRVKLRVDL